MLRDYYVYQLDDADGVPRYVGKGRGARAFFHEARVRAFINDPTNVRRVTRVHRRMAADGREFTLHFVAKDLTQAEAYDLEADLIRQYRRISEGGSLWNYLAGNPGWQGILHDDWCEVAARAVDTKGREGLRIAGRKAAATKGPEGHRLAGRKASVTKGPQGHRLAALKADATRRMNEKRRRDAPGLARQQDGVATG